MKSIIVAAVVSAFALGSVAMTAPALAQQKQKTVAACTAEWRANKADNQAKGITEKAYVAQCRGSNATSTPPAGATNNAAPAAAAPTTSSSTKPENNTRATATPPSRAQPAAAPTAANQFTSEGQAKLHCPSDTVVWANVSSRIYHFAGTKNYGNTKQGAYMCEKDATSSGFRASKTEKHP